MRPFLTTALARGVAEIGFTEHVYYFRQTAELWDIPLPLGTLRYDLDAMQCGAQHQAAGLPVKLGLEVDYVGDRQARLAELLEPYPFDFLLGSVHWLDGVAVAVAGRVGGDDGRRGWQRYIDALASSRSHRPLHVLAHPDLAKIFGRRPDPVLLAELHERVARAAAALRSRRRDLRPQVSESPSASSTPTSIFCGPSSAQAHPSRSPRTRASRDLVGRRYFGRSAPRHDARAGPGCSAGSAVSSEGGQSKASWSRLG